MEKTLAGCLLAFLLSVVATGCQPGAVHSDNTPASAGLGDKEVVVIDRIAGWRHAAKPVFSEYGFEITRVELRSAGRYIVFYVNPSDHGTRLDDYAFLTAVAKTNEFRDYEIVSPGGQFAEVRCNPSGQRVTWVTAGLRARYYGESEESAREKALGSTVSKLGLTFDETTQAYVQRNSAEEVVLNPLGFDDDGRYIIWVCPDDHTVSPLYVCYVNIADGAVAVD